jgi:hypothetical protein
LVHVFVCLPLSGSVQLRTLDELLTLLKSAVFWVLRSVALVTTDVSEERSASIIRVTRVGELGKTLAVTSNLRTLRGNTSILLYRQY